MKKVKYLATYQKSKKGNELRVLVDIDGTKTLLFLTENPVSGYTLEEVTGFIEKNPGNHTVLIGANRRYKYYFLRNEPQDLSDIFDQWINSNPLVHIGGFFHRKLSLVNNYKGSYLVENKIY